MFKKKFGASKSGPIEAIPTLATRTLMTIFFNLGAQGEKKTFSNVPEEALDTLKTAHRNQRHYLSMNR